MRLFIDCDDTLILWPPTPTEGQLYLGDTWLPNKPLVDAIRTLLETLHTATLVVWSGGGVDYASRWGRLLLDDLPWLGLSKDITLPTEEDWIVDDQILKVKGRLFLPNEFIYEVDALANGVIR